MRTRWQRIRWPLTVAVVVLVLYIGIYIRLSRRGMAEAEAGGWEFFFYCPVADLEPNNDLPWQHRLAYAAFIPINEIDHSWFGGGIPCRGLTWGFAPRSQPDRN